MGQSPLSAGRDVGRATGNPRPPGPLHAHREQVRRRQNTKLRSLLFPHPALLGAAGSRPGRVSCATKMLSKLHANSVHAAPDRSGLLHAGAGSCLPREQASTQPRTQDRYRDKQPPSGDGPRARTWLVSATPPCRRRSTAAGSRRGCWAVPREHTAQLWPPLVLAGARVQHPPPSRGDPRLSARLTQTRWKGREQDRKSHGLLAYGAEPAESCSHNREQEPEGMAAPAAHGQARPS